MNLYKEDLKKIGSVMFENNNNLVIVSDIELASIESILLREILLLFGDYKIMEENDFTWENDEDGIEFVTNLPYDLFKKLK